MALIDAKPKLLRQKLSHAYWIGGSACAGKTTVAERLAVEHGFHVYHCDEHRENHFERVNPDKHPIMHQMKILKLAGTAEEFFMRSPQEFAEVNRAWREEEFEMILDDLVALKSVKVVVEGVRLDPYLVHEIADPKRVIFMIAHKDFQREHYLERDFFKDLFQSFEDPSGAFENLMRCVAFMADSFYESARELGLKVLVTDNRSTVAQNLEVIRGHFGFPDP